MEHNNLFYNKWLIYVDTFDPYIILVFKAHCYNAAGDKDMGGLR